jgi:patatin-like phospholipase/acyl hydrolase
MARAIHTRPFQASSSLTCQNELKPVSRYHILSLDGNDLSAGASPYLLERLARANPELIKRVDLCAGVSMGAVLALALALEGGDDLSAIVSALQDLNRAVFSRSFNDQPAESASRYDNDLLRRQLRKWFGDAKLGDLPRHVLVVAFDLDNEGDGVSVMRTWKPKVFHNLPAGGDPELSLVEVAMYATARPAVFPIVAGYIDASPVVPNPAMCALVQALDRNGLGVSLADVVLLSIGNGVFNHAIQEEDVNWGMAQWAAQLVPLSSDTRVDSVEFQCRQLLRSHFHRLNPVFPEQVAGTDFGEYLKKLIQMTNEVNLNETDLWVKQVFTQP